MWVSILFITDMLYGCFFESSSCFASQFQPTAPHFPFYIVWVVDERS
uniref:Uncharacterized protein n=1 Tax=Rhizophora mucronata TaxID=61149 RepID=A0A2P2QHA9_RHIMU